MLSSKISVLQVKSIGSLENIKNIVTDKDCNVRIMEKVAALLKETKSFQILMSLLEMTPKKCAFPLLECWFSMATTEQIPMLLALMKKRPELLPLCIPLIHSSRLMSLFLQCCLLDNDEKIQLFGLSGIQTLLHRQPPLDIVFKVLFSRPIYCQQSLLLKQCFDRDLDSELIQSLHPLWIFQLVTERFSINVIVELLYVLLQNREDLSNLNDYFHLCLVLLLNVNELTLTSIHQLLDIVHHCISMTKDQKTRSYRLRLAYFPLIHIFSLGIPCSEQLLIDFTHVLTEESDLIEFYILPNEKSHLFHFQWNFLLQWNCLLSHLPHQWNQRAWEEIGKMAQWITGHTSTNLVFPLVSLLFTIIKHSTHPKTLSDSLLYGCSFLASLSDPYATHSITEFLFSLLSHPTLKLIASVAILHLLEHSSRSWNRLRDFILRWVSLQQTVMEQPTDQEMVILSIIQRLLHRQDGARFGEELLPSLFKLTRQYFNYLKAGNSYFDTCLCLTLDSIGQCIKFNITNPRAVWTVLARSMMKDMPWDSCSVPLKKQICQFLSLAHLENEGNSSYLMVENEPNFLFRQEILTQYLLPISGLTSDQCSSPCYDALSAFPVSEFADFLPNPSDIIQRFALDSNIVHLLSCLMDHENKQMGRALFKGFSGKRKKPLVKPPIEALSQSLHSNLFLPLEYKQELDFDSLFKDMNIPQSTDGALSRCMLPFGFTLYFQKYWVALILKEPRKVWNSKELSLQRINQQVPQILETLCTQLQTCTTPKDALIRLSVIVGFYNSLLKTCPSIGSVYVPSFLSTTLSSVPKDELIQSNDSIIAMMCYGISLMASGCHSSDEKTFKEMNEYLCNQLNSSHSWIRLFSSAALVNCSPNTLSKKIHDWLLDKNMDNLSGLALGYTCLLAELNGRAIPTALCSDMQTLLDGISQLHPIPEIMLLFLVISSQNQSLTVSTSLDALFNQSFTTEDGYVAQGLHDFYAQRPDALKLVSKRPIGRAWSLLGLSGCLPVLGVDHFEYSPEILQAMIELKNETLSGNPKVASHISWVVGQYIHAASPSLETALELPQDGKITDSTVSSLTLLLNDGFKISVQEDPIDYSRPNSHSYFRAIYEYLSAHVQKQDAICSHLLQSLAKQRLLPHVNWTEILKQALCPSFLFPQAYELVILHSVREGSAHSIPQSFIILYKSLLNHVRKTRLTKDFESQLTKGIETIMVLSGFSNESGLVHQSIISERDFFSLMDISLDLAIEHEMITSVIDIMTKIMALHHGDIDKKKRLVDMMIQKHSPCRSEYFVKGLAVMASWVDHLSIFWPVCTPLQKVYIMGSILFTPEHLMSMAESLKVAMEKNGDGNISLMSSLSLNQVQTRLFSAMCMFISSQSEQKELIEASAQHIHASIHQKEAIHWLCLYLDHLIIMTEPLKDWFHVPFTIITHQWPAFFQENLSKPLMKRLFKLLEIHGSKLPSDTQQCILNLLIPLWPLENDELDQLQKYLCQFA